MKIIYCLLGFTFLFSSIYMTLEKKNSYKFIHFMNLLDNQQKNIYKNIIRERLSIYLNGMILGFILGIYYYIHSKNDKYRICKFLTIIYSVKFGFYYFYPKQPLMLYSLHSKEQVDAWTDIYTEMKSRFKYSLFFGFIAYLIFTMVF